MQAELHTVSFRQEMQSLTPYVVIVASVRFTPLAGGAESEPALVDRGDCVLYHFDCINLRGSESRSHFSGHH